LSASAPELWIFDQSLLQPGTRPAGLVWRMEVTAANGAPVRELVLVNAQTGGISLHFNQIDTAWTSRGKATAQLDAQPQPVSSAPVLSVNPVLGTPLASTYTTGNTSTLPGTFLCNQAPIACMPPGITGTASITPV
jgi:hypothetical protein